MATLSRLRYCDSVELSPRTFAHNDTILYCVCGPLLPPFYTSGEVVRALYYLTKRGGGAELDEILLGRCVCASLCVIFTSFGYKGIPCVRDTLFPYSYYIMATNQHTIVSHAQRNSLPALFFPLFIPCYNSRMSPNTQRRRKDQDVAHEQPHSLLQYHTQTLLAAISDLNICSYHSPF